ncbi:MAG TPA: hypothetical protein VL137_06810, partial [Polyangiaceae bacterium]|nr:hypothetical protein [Polyangiaceae bacterium]
AGTILSPAARYIQLRARFNREPGAELSDVVIPFVRDNLRHVITSIDVDQAADDDVVKPGADVKASGGAFKKKPEHKVSLKWKLDNPDGDELVYRLQYRLVDGKDWYEMLSPGDRLTKDNYKWDTSALPEGRYRVRVTASDEISNPPGQVTRHQLESSIVVVDNTPPSILELKAQGKRVTAVAQDGVGPIAHMDISLGGSDDWYPFNPVDGVFDEPREELDADVASIVGNVPVLLNLRVFDQAGNSTVRSIPFK